MCSKKDFFTIFLKIQNSRSLDHSKLETMKNFKSNQRPSDCETSILTCGRTIQRKTVQKMEYSVCALDGENKTGTSKIGAISKAQKANFLKL